MTNTIEKDITVPNPDMPDDNGSPVDFGPPPPLGKGPGNDKWLLIGGLLIFALVAGFIAYKGFHHG